MRNEFHWFAIFFLTVIAVALVMLVTAIVNPSVLQETTP